MRGEWAGNCQIRSLLRFVSANEVLSQLPSRRSIKRKRGRGSCGVGSFSDWCAPTQAATGTGAQSPGPLARPIFLSSGRVTRFATPPLRPHTWPMCDNSARPCDRVKPALHGAFSFVTVGGALYSISLLLRNLCSLGGRLLGTKVTGPEVLWLTPGMQRSAPRREPMTGMRRPMTLALAVAAGFAAALVAPATPPFDPLTNVEVPNHEESIHAETRSPSWHRR
jgi:hypothetical protein